MSIDWIDYHRVHADRRNLILHLIAVPLFIVSFALTPAYFFRGDYASVVIALALAVIAMVLQGRGHALEAEPPVPFDGPVNFLSRWFREQFITFPIFVLSGRWFRQFRARQ